MAIEADGNRDLPTVCNHRDCVVDEPARLHERRLSGTQFTAHYCDRHDPLEDSDISGMWEAV